MSECIKEQILYNRSWLAPGKMFPPKSQERRLKRYDTYEQFFDIEAFENFNSCGYKLYQNFDMYLQKCPLLMGYQRLSTIKLCDMIVGSPPSITKKGEDAVSDNIQDLRDNTAFDELLYKIIIDFSRFGHSVTRAYVDDDDEASAQCTVWDPREWFPIFYDDGTKRIKEHILAWRINLGTVENPVWNLKVQIHPTIGNYYIERTYRMDSDGKTIGVRTNTEKKITNLPCMVHFIPNLPSSTNPFGTSDYKIINDLVVKATERMRQILRILDQHADPSMTGPSSLLEPRNPEEDPLDFDTANGSEYVFRTRKYYGVDGDDQAPQYLTWDGQLDSAFKALDLLLSQIYIFSEMGAALVGNTDGIGNVVSGTAMRYKMISPLEKARRVENSLMLPLKKLIGMLYYMEYGEQLSYKDISIVWEDSLPKDPREQAELVRILTGSTTIAPMKETLMEYYDMSAKEAEKWIKDMEEDVKRRNEISQPTTVNGNQTPASVSITTKKERSATNPGNTGSNNVKGAGDGANPN
jgi:hypothetical protein